MAIYEVQNRWGGESAPWHVGGTMVLGYRANQAVVDINIESGDGGKTFSGTMTYTGEGPIGFVGTQVSGNNYLVQNTWGGSGELHFGGYWIIGARDGQNVVKMEVSGDGETLNGNMTYAGEGPISFAGTEKDGTSYDILNRWGGESAPWHQGGTFVLGTRKDQQAVAFDIKSDNNGNTYSGTMTYETEGPIGFRAKNVMGNTYSVENQWGGSSAPWHPAGDFVIGARANQRCVALDIKSGDGGTTMTGKMTYAGEGPIGVEATVSSDVKEVEPA